MKTDVSAGQVDRLVGPVLFDCNIRIGDDGDAIIASGLPDALRVFMDGDCLKLNGWKGLPIKGGAYRCCVQFMVLNDGLARHGETEEFDCEFRIRTANKTDESILETYSGAFDCVL